MKIKKQLPRFVNMLFVAIALILISCNDDDDANPYVGSYSFGGSTFVNDVDIVLPGGSSITTIMGGPGSATTATLFVAGGLFDTAPCNPGSSDTPLVELRADGTSWLLCDGNSIQQGTWSFNEANNTLTLIVDGSNTSTGQDIPINISNVVLAGTSLSGTVDNFPLPLDANFTLGVPLNSGPYAGAPANLQLVAVDIQFIKMN